MKKRTCVNDKSFGVVINIQGVQKNIPVRQNMHAHAVCKLLLIFPTTIARPYSIRFFGWDIWKTKFSKQPAIDVDELRDQI